MGYCATLILVVVFPEAEKYFRDYFVSISNQSYKNCDLLILNDGIMDFSYVCTINSTVVDVQEGLSIAEIRMTGILYAIERSYKNIIFSDVDDFYSANRVEQSLAQLKNANFVYNRIIPVDDMGSIQQSGNDTKFILPNQISSSAKLLDFNLFGLSNTAVELRLLENLIIPKEILAVDWWLYTILLLNGAKGKYIYNASTYYRQTDNNIVGMNKSLDDDRLDLGISVKYAHYLHIYEYCKDHGVTSKLDAYALRKEQIIDLKTAVGDNEFRKQYIKTINLQLDNVNKGWWSEILTLPEWDKL
jgi:hypothetical protein